MKRARMMLNLAGEQIQQGLAVDSIGLGRGRELFLAKKRVTINTVDSTPARPLPESPILAGFFCTGATVSQQGGAR
jgi:hypothetical protein